MKSWKRVFSQSCQRPLYSMETALVSHFHTHISKIKSRLLLTVLVGKGLAVIWKLPWSIPDGVLSKVKQKITTWKMTQICYFLKHLMICSSVHLGQDSTIMGSQLVSLTILVGPNWLDWPTWLCHLGLTEPLWSCPLWSVTTWSNYHGWQNWL